MLIFEGFAFFSVVIFIFLFYTKSMDGYSITKKRKGRRNYNFFGLFNEFSYTLLIGNIVILYLLRLHTSNSFIGLISSFSYVSFFFILFGKKILKRLKIIKTMGWAWVLRNTVLIPMIISPYLAYQGKVKMAAIVIFVSTFLFHTVRGVGLVGNSPLVRELSAGKDRGKFLSTYQTFVNLSVLLASLTIIVFLKEDVSIYVFSGFFILGIIAGFIGTGFLFAIPEPEGGYTGADDKLFDSLTESLKNPAVRKFLIPFSFFLFTSAMARPFILVYAKEILSISDRSAMILSVGGTIGVITMGIISGFLLDRIGAKPLIIVYAFVTVISLIPGFISSSFIMDNFFIFTSFMFFFFQLGSLGAVNGFQTYFYSIISQRDQVNLGIIYFFIMGITGALGSNMGGWYLDLLRHFFPENTPLIYRLFFLTILLFISIAIILMGRLESKGAEPLPKALRIMFSLKDLRAIGLMNKLENSGSVEDEQKVIREIAGSHSSFPEREVLKKLDSPSYAVRSEALYALSRMKITPGIQEALVNQIENYEYTTASIAARICGQQRILEAVPVLRKSLESSDYLLVSKAMLSLAQLGDNHSLGPIERIMAASENPMVLIHGISALKLFSRIKSIKTLFALLTRPNLPSYLREEIFVALSGIMDFEDWFYRFYIVYRDDPDEGIELLLDQLDRKGVSKGIEFSFITYSNLGTVDFIVKASAFLETMSIDRKLKVILVSGLETENISTYKGLGFLVAAFIVYNYVK